MAKTRRKKTAVASIVGTRPQFIKLAALAPALSQRTRHIVIFSGQHYDHNLSDLLLKQLGVDKPNLNLRVGSGSHGWQTGRMLQLCEEALLKYSPGLVLVYGDTNTTLAGALAAAKLGLPVGHVEAGLRSGRMDMPEEINRKVTDHISSLLFYPTSAARSNLRAEGINRGLVHSGDLMYELIGRKMPEAAGIKTIADEFGLMPGGYVLVTIHRAENVDHPDRLKKVIDLLRAVDLPKLFLMHPRTKKNLRKFRLFQRLSKSEGLIIAEPQAYLQTLALIQGARAVITDSGGIQKEAGFLGCPCLTLRSETEWIETVEKGANILIGLSPTAAGKAIANLPRLRPRKSYLVRGEAPSAIIAEAVSNFMRKRI